MVGVAVHISHAFPPRGAYKLSGEGLVATLRPSSCSGHCGVTKTARSQPSRKQVLFLANYTAKLWDIRTEPGGGFHLIKQEKGTVGGLERLRGGHDECRYLSKIQCMPNISLRANRTRWENCKVRVHGVQSAKEKKNVAPSLTLRLNYLLYC